MATQTTEDHRCPQLVAASMIATPVLFFAVLAVIGPLPHFAAYLFLAWTIAAVTSTTTYVIDEDFAEQFNRSERLAMLAANGMVALLVASMSFMAVGLY